MSILPTLLPTIWEVMVRDFRLQDFGFKGGGGGGEWRIGSKRTLICFPTGPCFQKKNPAFLSTPPRHKNMYTIASLLQSSGGRAYLFS